MMSDHIKSGGFDILPVGDQGVMLRFGDVVCDEIHAKVLAADYAVQTLKPKGLTETIPSFASLFVGYDPIVTDTETFSAELKNMIIAEAPPMVSRKVWDVPVCFEDDFAPDLSDVAAATGMSGEAVINRYLSAEYRVYMYGFAPGYAYLGGVPEALQLPRKPAPVPDVAAGSIIIAGAQCLMTTLVMPTGWWIIGRTPFPILHPKAENPFPVNVGDDIHFYRVSRGAFDAYDYRDTL